jgi:hypothetical protein
LIERRARHWWTSSKIRPRAGHSVLELRSVVHVDVKLVEPASYPDIRATGGQNLIAHLRVKQRRLPFVSESCLGVPVHVFVHVPGLQA